MEELSQSVFVWPPPHQSLFYRQKLQLAAHLDVVASLHTHTSRPRTHVLKEIKQFTRFTVLKCEGSCESQHWYFYDRASAPKISKACLTHNSKILDAGNADAADLDARHGMLWLVQDLVEELKLYGEYRIFVVGGKIVSVVGTTPVRGGDWVVKDCRLVYGLTELLWVNHARLFVCPLIRLAAIKSTKILSPWMCSFAAGAPLSSALKLCNDFTGLSCIP
jgi:hypothetical protein